MSRSKDTMKTRSETYRKNAAEAYQLAMEAKDEPSRKRYLRTAKAWLDLAEEEASANGETVLSHEPKLSRDA